MRSEHTEGIVDRKLESGEGAGFESAEALFELGPALLDWVEVGRVRRQIEQRCSGRTDEFLYAGDFVRSEIVHHHNLSGLELRTQNVLQISEKDVAIGGRLNHHRAHPAGKTDGTQHRQGAPVACGNSFVDTLTAHRPPIPPGHFRCDPAFVEENEALRIDLFACFLPKLSFCGDLFPLLFGGLE